MNKRYLRDLELVTTALSEAGLVSVRAPRPGGVDLVVPHPKGDLAIEVKSMGTARLEDLEGRLAMGILHLQKNPVPEAAPMVAVVVDRFGAKAEAAARRFMNAYAPGMAWCLVGRNGGAYGEIPRHGLTLDLPPLDEPRRSRGTNAHLFSDLNRWLLKVLLLGPDPKAHFGGPRLERPVRNPTELHRIANVSVEKAHRFTRTFEEAGFLRRTRRGLLLEDRRLLLERWLDDERVRPTPQVPMRSIFGGQFSVTDLLDRLEEGDYAIGGFHAAASLGALHALRAQAHLHIRSRMVPAMKQLDLVESRRTDANLVLVGTRNVESVLRAAQARGGHMVTDEIQAALDVVNDPARGHEQAHFIIERLVHRWGRQ